MAVGGGKRPAPEGAPASYTDAADGGKKKTKRARPELGDIYNYEKLEVLGEGTYGVVVKGPDRRTGETVAIKWIRPTAIVASRGDGGRQRAVVDLLAVSREAGCMRACGGHPSVVQLREVAGDGATRTT